MAAITYTPQEAIPGPTFTCRRCHRVYAFPRENERPIRCECGWWYRNAGRNAIVEEFNPRIGGSDSDAPQARN
jgi:hypothetical protein